MMNFENKHNRHAQHAQTCTNTTFTDMPTYKDKKLQVILNLKKKKNYLKLLFLKPTTLIACFCFVFCTCCTPVGTF